MPLRRFVDLLLPQNRSNTAFINSLVQIDSLRKFFLFYVYSKLDIRGPIAPN